MELTPQMQRALKYIRNTGGSPKIEHFDEDHEPVGPRLRAQLVEATLVVERDGKIYEVVPTHE